MEDFRNWEWRNTYYHWLSNDFLLNQPGKLTLRSPWTRLCQNLCFQARNWWQTHRILSHLHIRWFLWYLSLTRDHSEIFLSICWLWPPCTNHFRLWGCGLGNRASWIKVEKRAMNLRFLLTVQANFHNQTKPSFHSFQGFGLRDLLGSFRCSSHLWKWILMLPRRNF